MSPCISTTLTWLGRAFSEPDGTASSRRVLFALVVVCVLALVTGVLWSTRTLTPEIVDLLKWALTITGGTLALGKFAESPSSGA